MALLMHDHPIAPHRPIEAGLRARAVRRGRAVDLLQVLAVVSVAVVLAMYLKYGGIDLLANPRQLLYGLGMIAGLIGSQLCLIMLLLAARLPIIDRIFGHDKALALHGKLGKPVFYLLLAHMALLIVGKAIVDGHDVIAATLGYLADLNYVLAFASIVLFSLVAITSFISVKRRLGFETWAIIHLLSYSAVLTALPHQIAGGTMFSDGLERAWWLAEYVLIALAIVIFRFAVPLCRSLRHRVVVERVDRIDASSVSVVVKGHDLDRLGTRGGQFFNWRFWAPGIWSESHPYSVAGIGADRLRIAVRASGDGSAALAGLRPGTLVSIEGPYGRFVERSRTQPRVAVFAAGMGIAPIVSLLSDFRLEQGQATVVVRTSEASEIPLRDEVLAEAKRLGARVIALEGRRVAGDWRPREVVAKGWGVAQFVPHIYETDFYLCGPTPWSDALVAELVELGVATDAIHNERFDW